MPPRSALECMAHIQAGLKAGLPIRFATVTGRFYAMDRDKRWERVALAYDALVDIKGERAGTPIRRSRRVMPPSYDDEFVLPTVIEGYTGIEGRRRLLMFNFRSDRAREILTALLDPRFDGFNRARVVKFAMAVGMVDYSAALNLSSRPCSARGHQDSLGETISKAGPRNCASPRPRSTRTSRSSSTAAMSADNKACAPSLATRRIWCPGV